MLLEDCQRCNGKGYIEIRLGLAGQDPRQIGACNIVWGDRYPPSPCNACNQTGQRRQRPTEPSRRIEPDPIDFIGETLK